MARKKSEKEPYYSSFEDVPLDIFLGRNTSLMKKAVKDLQKLIAEKNEREKRLKQLKLDPDILIVEEAIKKIGYQNAFQKRYNGKVITPMLDETLLTQNLGELNDIFFEDTRNALEKYLDSVVASQIEKSF